MNIYQFMSESPILTFSLVAIVLLFIEQVVTYTTNRMLRHWNIRKHGYPPEHCDADGDFKNYDV